MKLYKKNLKKLINSKVYHPNMEHDACGVGLVVSTEGKKSRKIVEYGIEALKAVWHRGAVDADGKTGDGAGIHVEISRDFFKEKIENYGRQYDGGEICVGMIFLPRNDYNSQEKCKTLIETELLSNNYYIYRWRQVPINTGVLGIKAELTRPEIVQVIFKSKDRNLKDKDLERQLYEIRRTIEKKVSNSQLKDFYICSFSSKSIIYKGMFLAETLSDFYPDLQDERFISRFAIFHQRYSTNTFPSWDLAQPFRTLAHNGEINTLKGNINWMKIHEQEMKSEFLFYYYKKFSMKIKDKIMSNLPKNIWILKLTSPLFNKIKSISIIKFIIEKIFNFSVKRTFPEVQNIKPLKNIYFSQPDAENKVILLADTFNINFEIQNLIYAIKVLNKFISKQLFQILIIHNFLDQFVVEELIFRMVNLIKLTKN